MNYLNNTIFTNYALHKLANNLANPDYLYSPYQFISIKIGDGDNTLNLDKESLSKTLYTLNINNIKITSNTITFTCEIPAEIKDINITEIGLFDKSENGEKLFSYSRVNTIKPSEIGYELVVELNISLKTVNYYPEKIKLRIIEDNYITKEMLNNLKNVFLYVETNLERIIDFNSHEIGLYKEQSFYDFEKNINNILNNYSYANKYFNLYIKYKNNLKNSFFIEDKNFLNYIVKDLVTNTAKINIYLNLLESFGDNINFASPTTLTFTVKLGEILKDKQTPILNKIQNGSIYFNIYIENNKLIFLLQGTDGSYNFSFDLDDSLLPMCEDNYNTYTISFNGDFINPNCNLYLNGTKKSIVQNTDGLESILDYSGYSLKNYYISNDEISIAPDIKFRNILFINKYISDQEAHDLYILQKEFNLESSS